MLYSATNFHENLAGSFHAIHLKGLETHNLLGRCKKCFIKFTKVFYFFFWKLLPHFFPEFFFFFFQCSTQCFLREHFKLLEMNNLTWIIKTYLITTYAIIFIQSFIHSSVTVVYWSAFVVYLEPIHGTLVARQEGDPKEDTSLSTVYKDYIPGLLFTKCLCWRFL